MKQIQIRVIFSIGILVILSSCTGTEAVTPSFFPVPQAIGVDGASVLSTGKTISDHIVSFATGKNCSTVRTNIGQHYCEEDEVAVPDEVYCYNTLGDVSCYALPAPHGENYRHLGQIPNRHNSPR